MTLKIIGIWAWKLINYFYTLSGNWLLLPTFKGNFVPWRSGVFPPCKIYSRPRRRGEQLKKYSDLKVLTKYIIEIKSNLIIT